MELGLWGEGWEGWEGWQVNMGMRFGHFANKGGWHPLIIVYRGVVETYSTAVGPMLKGFIAHSPFAPARLEWPLLWRSLHTNVGRVGRARGHAAINVFCLFASVDRKPPRYGLVNTASCLAQPQRSIALNNVIAL